MQIDLDVHVNDDDDFTHTNVLSQGSSSHANGKHSVERRPNVVINKLQDNDILIPRKIAVEKNESW